MRIAYLFAFTAAAVISVGCGGSAAPQQQAAATTNTAAAKAVPADPRTPEQVVSDFLASSQKGDTQTKVTLLTPAARAEWQRAEKAGSGFSMGVEASPTLTFQVKDVELVGETKQEAHVASQLTDKDGDGQPVSESIVWFLLQEEEGWRISGMAMNVIDGELPLILDFENQAEMERKIQMLNQEIARREQDAARQNEIQKTSNSKPSNSPEQNKTTSDSQASRPTAVRKR